MYSNVVWLVYTLNYHVQIELSLDYFVTADVWWHDGVAYIGPIHVARVALSGFGLNLAQYSSEWHFPVFSYLLCATEYIYVSLHPILSPLTNEIK